MSRLFSLSLAAWILFSAAACRNASSETPQSPDATASAAAAPEVVKPVPAELPDVLARVNGEDVKKADFELLVRNMELGGAIPPERRDEVLREALDRLITYTVLQQEARARGLTVPDAEVNEAMKTMRQQFPDEATFEKALADRSMSVERLQKDTRTDMVISKMLDTEVETAPVASDADVREFYEQNPDKFRRDESVRASHILILVDENANEASRKKARATIDDVLARARAGEDFGKLARAHSQDGSASQGGDLNYFPRGQMVPPFEEAAFALEPGKVSDVVTTQFGYHIIKVTDRKPAESVPLEQVSDRVKQFLTEQNKQERADAFISSLKQKSRIEVLI